MKQEPADDRTGKRGAWLVVCVISLFMLSVFWSVDASFFYILAGVSAVSLYKFFQNRQSREEAEPEKTYQQTYYSKPSFLDEIKDLFNKSAPVRDSRRQSRLVVFIIAAVSGFIFLVVIITAVFSDDPYATSSELRERAGNLYNQQRYDSAAYFYRLAILNDPENADLYLERGNAFLNANNTDSALMDYDRALLLRPSYKEAYYNKGLIYYNRKQYRNSINQTKYAVDIDPDYTDAMLLIGDDFYNSSQLDSAMIWYENAYSKGYRSAALSHIMAYIYDTKGNTQKAILLYKETLSYDTTRTEIYTRLGELVGGDEGNLYRQKAAQYPR
jgi:tetratricopeptide (TPR) repeat protein